MNSTERQRKWRAKQYAAGYHFVRGRLVKTPRKQRAPGEVPQHGTVGRYEWTRNPCRCLYCREANSEYHRGKRARAKARKDQLMQEGKWRRVAELLEMETTEQSTRTKREIFVTVNQHVDGFILVDVRRVFKKDNEWQATKQGISMSPDQWATVVAVIQTWLDEQEDQK